MYSVIFTDCKHADSSVRMVSCWHVDIILIKLSRFRPVVQEGVQGDGILWAVLRALRPSVLY